MDIKEAIKTRHSVRQYLSKPIPDNIKTALQEEIEKCNRESGLKIQPIYGDSDCFTGFLAHYGKFKNVQNYIAMVGPKSGTLDETVGYYGQRIVLFLQMQGLNTCWVGGTYKKGKCNVTVSSGEKVVCVIAFGYGVNEGLKRTTKPMEKLCNVPEKEMPGWFKNGMKAAMMAPTAINQQKFYVELDGEEVTITSKPGPFSKVDLGIVKYNFEAASGYKVKNTGPGK